jgi:hypothetical protein
MHRAGRAKDSSSCYEEMNRDRSRTQELASVYLEAERELVCQFGETHHLQGPCLAIGCGVGLFADTVPNFIGLEYNLQDLPVLGFQGFRRVCSDATGLPFDSGVVQMAFSFNSLEHVAAIDLAFAKIDLVSAALRGSCAEAGLALRKIRNGTRPDSAILAALDSEEVSESRASNVALVPL